MAPQADGSGATQAAPVNVVGAVQGLVIGDHNTVTQHFNVTRHEAYVARESGPVPAHWIERAALFAQAGAALQGGSVVALCGMGGAGKSALAARIAGALRDRFSDGCFWVDAAGEDPDEALLRMALAFGHDISLLKSREARARTVHSLLTGRAVLVVLDDVWSPDCLGAFLPLPLSCAALLTTRNDGIAASFADDVVSVDAFSMPDAAALLAAVTGCDPQEPMLERVATALGGLPLAIELAGKLARQQGRRPGFSWPTFAARLEDGAHRLALGLAGSSVRAAFELTWENALGPEARRAFALLGIFAPGPISSAEAAAAWDAGNEQAIGWITELIDLSLLRLTDPVTLSLHPLLADYASALASELAPDERRLAHCRVADHLFEIAPRPPRSVRDITVVLRAHFHAAQAGDRERAHRTYPWFGEGDAHTAVPGFLIDHGLYQTYVRHERLEVALRADSSPWARAWASFQLGQALQMNGELEESEQRIQDAVSLMETSCDDDRGRAVGLSKFLMVLGQVRAQSGKLEEAEAAIRRSVEIDRQTDAAGGVSGAREGALIGLLQLSDLHAASGRPEGMNECVRICNEVITEAEAHGAADIVVMACERIVRHTWQGNPEQALTILRALLPFGDEYPSAFGGRQGARYARRLAETARDMTLSRIASAEDALAFFRLAITRAGGSGAWQELGQALYHLGNLFEHYFLIDREAPLAAAWACYALSEAYMRDNEGGPPLNGQFRIESRIMPRLGDAAGETAAAVRADPWGLIDAEMPPGGLGWRPDGRRAAD